MKVFPTARLSFEKFDVDIERRTVSGGTALSGDDDLIETDGGGRWSISADAPYLDDQNVARAWDALSAYLGGGATPIIVPLTDADRQAMGDIPLPPGGLPWWDESEFVSGQPQVTVAAAAALRATQIELDASNCPKAIRFGQIFSIDHPNMRHRPYRVITFDEVTGIATFRPPLREAVADGEVVDFVDPKCVMRVDGEMRAPRTFGFADSAVRFVEHFAENYA